MSATPDTEAPFDIERLTDYLEQAALPLGEPIEVLPLSGGQSNPTFRLKAEGAQYVLRKKPEGHLLPGAHAVDREYG